MLGEFLVALLIGLVLALLFAYALGRPGPWAGPLGGVLWFFLVVFLGAWAIAVWVEPVGPALWGVAWVPIFLGALLIALLIAAIPPREPGPPAAGITPEAETAETAAAVGLFFWALLLGLMIVIVLALLL